MIQKFKSERSLLRLLAIDVVLVILCLIIGMFHADRIYRSFQEMSYDYIFDRAQVTSRYFSADFERKGNLVHSEAVVLEETDTVGG